MEVINALMRNTIDVKRAELILRALHIAVKNARRVKFDIHKTSMVKEVPDYAEAATMEGVGTDAFVSLPRAEPRGPGGPEVPGRSAVPATIHAPVTDPETDFDLPAVAATTYKPVHEDPTFWERWEEGGRRLACQDAEARAKASVGRTPSSAQPASIPAHGGADASVSLPRAEPRGPNGPEVPGRSAVAAEAPDPTTKKPPVNVKAAPEERKIAAHGASRG